MRRYLITERWVLMRVILIPSTMITKNSSRRLLVSRSSLKSG